MSSAVVIGVVASLAVAAGVIATAIIVENNQDATKSNDSDYLQYYIDNKSETDKFQVLDVYMRPDNTFIQGLYYDPET